MTELLGPPDEGEPEEGGRGRAVWGLSILAMVAVVLVSAVVLFGGAGDDEQHRAGPTPPRYSTQPASGTAGGTASPSGPATSSPPPASSTAAPSEQTSSSPPSTSPVAQRSTAQPPPPAPPSSPVSSAPSPLTGGLADIERAIYTYRRDIPHNFVVMPTDRFMACALVADPCGANPAGWVAALTEEALLAWLRANAPSTVDATALQGCHVGWADFPTHRPRVFVIVRCEPAQR